jgi:hypothetical protein
MTLSKMMNLTPPILVITASIMFCPSDVFSGGAAGAKPRSAGFLRAAPFNGP